MALTRLQKVLAKAGFASRRKSEEIISSGRVRVNGKIVTELGAKADPDKDKIEVDGRQVVFERPITLLMNKPRGVVCTASDPQGRETVVDLVRKVKARLFPVGRLDFATSGALLLTNDGELANSLTHPRYGVEKTYLLKIRGTVDEAVLNKWREGVDIGDGPGTKLKYLRRMPLDPITNSTDWSTRSSRDQPDSLFTDHINIFDVRTKSDKVALDGTRYDQW